MTKLKFSKAICPYKEDACNILVSRLIKNGIMNVWHDAAGKGDAQFSDTAVGITWEKLNGIKSNSRPGPDEFITVRNRKVGLEYKAALGLTDSLGTLFCKEADIRNSNRMMLDTCHQWSADKERYGLFATITVGGETNIDGNIISLLPDGDSFAVTVNGNPMFEWSAETLKRAAQGKLNHILVRAKAHERVVDGKRQFMFYSVSFHTEFQFRSLISAFNAGNAVIDYRCYYTGEKLKRGNADEIRNHGTAFRMVDYMIPDLFDAHAYA